MKIVIAGTGDTATHLAKMLSRESQDVVVMGRDSDILDELDRNYNLLTLEGDPVSPDSLRNAGTPGCDLFIAVTPFGNHNLISAQLAKWLGAGRTLARIDNSELIDAGAASHMASLGVDRLVYPEMLASHEIRLSLNHPWLRKIYPLCDGRIKVCSLKIGPGAPLAGTRLRDFDKSAYGIHICAIKRDSTTIIPGGNDTIDASDIIYFTVAPGADEEALMKLCGKRGSQRVRRIMIAGGGKMTEAVMAKIDRDFEVTIVEPDRDMCEALAMKCPRATIVCGDFRDVDLLRDEGLKQCDAMMALSDSAEKNIVSSLVAKSLGVRFTIAQIEDIQYFSQAEDLNIDVIVNKKLLTSSRIYQMLLDKYLNSPRCLAFEDAEVAEIEAHEGSAITRRPVRELRLDKSMTIAAMVSGDRAGLVDGDTRIAPGDRIVVFCLRGHLKHIEELFGHRSTGGR